MAEPELDVEAIERRAVKLLTELPPYVWNGADLPIPVEDIADTCFGLLVRDQDDMAAAPGAPPLRDGQSLSGLLLPSRQEIWVNAEEARRWPPRRRFTIGHELGHFLLHSRDNAVMCRHASIDPADDQPAPAPASPPAVVDHRKAKLPLPEAEANAFAAALLMPAPLIKRFYKSTGKDFDHLCSLFDSSRGAMGRRLHAVI